jgi:hypothetical protein
VIQQKSAKRLFAVILTLYMLAESPSVLSQPDLSGIWEAAGRNQEGELSLTDHALEIQSEYDLLNDDPSLQCVPASLGRVITTPNVRFQILLSEIGVQFNYRMFDLRRKVAWLGSSDEELEFTTNISGDSFAVMGKSRAFWTDDELVVITEDLAAGYVRTSTGVPQAETTTSIERYWLDEMGDLRIELTYFDDSLFEMPFTTRYRFVRSDSQELGLYECTDPSYEWFEKLNQ